MPPCDEIPQDILISGKGRSQKSVQDNKIERHTTKKLYEIQSTGKRKSIRVILTSYNMCISLRELKPIEIIFLMSIIGKK